MVAATAGVKRQFFFVRRWLLFFSRCAVWDWAMASLLELPNDLLRVIALEFHDLAVVSVTTQIGVKLAAPQMNRLLFSDLQS
jgi:hypothetical protein